MPRPARTTLFLAAPLFAACAAPLPAVVTPTPQPPSPAPAAPPRPAPTPPPLALDDRPVVALTGPATRLPGAPGDGLHAIGGVADARDGTIVFADATGGRLYRLAPETGDLVHVAGAGGGTGGGTADDDMAPGPALEARFLDPGDVAVAPDGAIYVADRGHAAVRRVTRAGRAEAVAGGFTALAGIALDAGATALYAGDATAVKRVELRDAAGAGARPAALVARGTGVRGVAVDQEGRVVFADAAGLHRVEGDRVRDLAAPGPDPAGWGAPLGIAVLRDGGLLFSDGRATATLWKWDGTRVAAWAGGGTAAEGRADAVGFVRPGALAVSADGTVWVGETRGGRVVRVRRP